MPIKGRKEKKKMNKLFSKVAALSVGLAMAIGVGVALGSNSTKEVRAESEIEFTLSSAADVEQEGVSASFGKGSGSNAPAWYPAGLRLYAKNTVTISSSDSITGVSFNWEKQGNKAFASVTADVGDYVHPSAAGTGTWTGSANEIVFTLGDSGQLQLNTFTVTTGGSAKTLTSIVLTKDDSSVKKSYYVGESASKNGLTVTAYYDDESSKDVTSSATITANPATVALSTTSITYSATYGEMNSNSVTVSGITVTRENLVEKAYAVATNASVNVTGKYMGSVNDGYYIMNGAYGIFIYKGTLPTGAVEGESLLSVSGTKAYFRGLHQVSNSTATIDPTIDIDPVQLYTLTGSETYTDEELASRRTHINGVVTSIIFNNVEYDKTISSEEEAAILATVGDSTTGKDITVNIDNSTIVFFKKGDQTTDLVTTLISNLRGETNITVAAFTSVYNYQTTQQFQLRFLKFVEAKEDYTAEEFAQDLLDQTDTVCAGWEEGDNNHDALVTIWTDLNSEEKYQALPQAQKDILAEADRDESGSVIEQAMARYDFLTGKYSLDNFITGRTPIVSSGMMNYGELDLANNSTIVIVISIATVSALAFTMLLVFKKKKQK